MAAGTTCRLAETVMKVTTCRDTRTTRRDTTRHVANVANKYLGLQTTFATKPAPIYEN